MADELIFTSGAWAVFAVRTLDQGNLSVAPTTNYSAAGGQGTGNYTPTGKKYRISNLGSAAFRYQITSDVNWIDIIDASGIVGGNTNLEVSVGINIGEADLLTPDTYTGTLTFHNLTTDLGSDTRDLSLVINSVAAANLSVTPSEDYDVIGVSAGSFEPASAAYFVSNAGGTDMDWEVSSNENWVAMDVSTGTLAADASAMVIVSTIQASAQSFTSGVESGRIFFGNLTNAVGNQTRDASLTILSPGDFSVSPTGTVTVSGVDGNASSTIDDQQYTITNFGGDTFDLEVSSAQSWVTITPSSRTIASGAQGSITVAVNGDVTGLADETAHTATIEFINGTSGLGNTTRSFVLNLSSEGGLEVSPTSIFQINGPEGGPFTRSSKTYTLTNSGQDFFDWSTSTDVIWIESDVSSGRINYGESQQVVFSTNANALSLTAGTYDGIIQFTNDTSNIGNVDLDAMIIVNATGGAPEGLLVVVEQEDMEISRDEGDPFSVVTSSYTVSNIGTSALDFSVSTDVTWIEADVSSGTLTSAVGDINNGSSITWSTNVNVTALVPGTHTGTLQFNDDTNGSSVTRDATVTVNATGTETFAMIIQPDDPTARYSDGFGNGVNNVGYIVSNFSVSPSTLTTVSSGSTPGSSIWEWVLFNLSSDYSDGKSYPNKRILCKPGHYPGFETDSSVYGSPNSSWRKINKSVDFWPSGIRWYCDTPHGAIIDTRNINVTGTHSTINSGDTIAIGSVGYGNATKHPNHWEFDGFKIEGSARYAILFSNQSTDENTADVVGWHFYNCDIDGLNDGQKGQSGAWKGCVTVIRLYRGLDTRFINCDIHHSEAGQEHNVYCSNMQGNNWWVNCNLFFAGRTAFQFLSKPGQPVINFSNVAPYGTNYILDCNLSSHCLDDNNTPTPVSIFSTDTTYISGMTYYQQTSSVPIRSGGNQSVQARGFGISEPGSAEWQIFGQSRANNAVFLVDNSISSIGSEWQAWRDENTGLLCHIDNRWHVTGKAAINTWHSAGNTVISAIYSHSAFDGTFGSLTGTDPAGNTLFNNCTNQGTGTAGFILGRSGSNFQWPVPATLVADAHNIGGQPNPGFTTVSAGTWTGDPRQFIYNHLNMLGEPIVHEVPPQGTFAAGTAVSGTHAYPEMVFPFT